METFSTIPNSIFNECCLSTMSRMADKSIDVVITSPPYNMNLRIRNGKYYQSLLEKACIFFDNEDVADPNPTSRYINLNDTFYYAVADTEEVKEDEIDELGRLFHEHGMIGVYFWVIVNKRMGKSCFDELDYEEILNYTVDKHIAKMVFNIYLFRQQQIHISFDKNNPINKNQNFE